MAILLVLCKLCIVFVYVRFYKLIRTFKSYEKNAKFEIDLLSRIELSGCVGLNLVGLIAVIDKSTYVFTLVLCIIGICLAYFQSKRVILVGDKKILFNGEIHNIKDVKKLGTGMVTLKIYTRQNPKGYSIFVPLTSNNVLKNKLQAKLK